jgi:uncharacterized membrane protein
MTTTLSMLETHPRRANVDRTRLAAVIDALNACAETCTACADACLSEESVAELARCIALNLNCADICLATARMLSRHAGEDGAISRSMLEACATVCRACAEECAKHAERQQHCRVCAEACRSCERACRDLVVALR